MSPHRLTSLLCLVLAVSFLVGCTDETVALKQKIADLEKRLQKQEKDLKEFSTKFAPQKDFSADIQRIEDQQEKITQTIKAKVDPVNLKLEEFRDWAQEAQKERESVTKKLKALETAATDLQKRIENERGEAGKTAKDVLVNKKSIQLLSKNIEDLTKGYTEVRKELTDNNEKVISAVKKTIPKIKEAAVADIKAQIAPLEQSLSALKNGLENDRKNLAAAKPIPGPTVEPLPASGGKDVQLLVKRIKELEDIVTAQKAFLLEMGSKMHELELQLRGVSGITDQQRPLSRR